MERDGVFGGRRLEGQLEHQMEPGVLLILVRRMVKPGISA